jgi:hypothetical protein
MRTEEGCKETGDLFEGDWLAFCLDTVLMGFGSLTEDFQAFGVF